MAEMRHFTDLLEEVRSGDDEAFARLCRLVVCYLQARAAALGATGHAIDEIVQSVQVKLFEELRRVKVFRIEDLSEPFVTSTKRLWIFLSRRLIWSVINHAHRRQLAAKRNPPLVTQGDADVEAIADYVGENPPKPEQSGAVSATDSCQRPNLTATPTEKAVCFSDLRAVEHLMTPFNHR